MKLFIASAGLSGNCLINLYVVWMKQPFKILYRSGATLMIFMLYLFHNLLPPSPCLSVILLLLLIGSSLVLPYNHEGLKSLCAASVFSLAFFLF